ncbi:MAG: aminopeptidase [Treponema sp.]|jgi:predicted aminopeptidase|nr:aminopeptidase [Treponema sp.]
MSGFKITLFPFLPIAGAIILALGFFLCSGCYTLKQGTAMLGYLGKAIPLEELADRGGPGAAGENRAFVERVADIRRFAMEDLGLAESKNYTRYVEIDRDYLAAVVSACAADSFTRHEWRFPVVGTVPYKGFFDPKDAGKEAARLKKDGLDVWIRGVDAFSTLGWFRDPLYSYMKNYQVHQLADLIIHELLHATVFIKGHSAFNEQLAEFVGTQGARIYTESRFGADSPEYRAIDESIAATEAFRRYLGGLIGELEGVYGDSGLDREAKLAEKERIITAAKERFEEALASGQISERYRFFSELPVNNAYLDLYRLYYEEDRFFEDLYKKNPGDLGEAADLRRFIGAAKTLNPKKGDLRDQLEKALK